jgi:outer membrane protein assembly factor BamD (BamD/ComL family)
MANALHVAKLREGVRAWNAWRAQSPDTAPDLSDLDLPVGLLQLGPAQGGPIDLSRADLRRAALGQATLIAADLRGAMLAGADLSQARLASADLSGADLTSANLAGADLQGAGLDGANLAGARLQGVRNLTQAWIERASGDAATVLPAGLQRPRDWLAAGASSSRVAKVLPPGPDRAVLASGDPYAILGVRRRASLLEIRAAYLRLVKELHPDGRAADPAARDADERLKLINEAYQELKGFGGRATARKAERRNLRRRVSAVFLVGALTSAAPVLVVLAAGFYYAGWLEPHEAAPRAVAERDATSSGAVREARPEVGSAEVTKTASDIAKTDLAAEREAAWADARGQATREPWERFLATHPDGERADQARQALAAIERAEARQREERTAWAAAERSGAKLDLQRYVEAFPDSERAAEAEQTIATIERVEMRQREERVAWAAAERSGARDELRRFVEAYPESEHVPQANRALAALAAAEAQLEADLAAWGEADRDGGKAALRRYLASFPSGTFAAKASERVAVLEAEEADRDEAAWLKAVQRNSKAAYTGYLATHPEGRRVADARTRIAELDRSEDRAVPEPAKAPATRPRTPEPATQKWQTANEPFIGADGRIRR